MELDEAINIARVSLLRGPQYCPIFVEGNDQRMVEQFEAVIAQEWEALQVVSEALSPRPAFDFTNVFDLGVPIHLNLMRGKGPMLQPTLSIFNECALNTQDIDDLLVELFTVGGWRYTLIGLAVLLLGHGGIHTDILWERLRVGSWVAPQIVSTLIVIDPNFVRLARLELERGSVPAKAFEALSVGVFGPDSKSDLTDTMGDRRLAERLVPTWAYSILLSSRS